MLRKYLITVLVLLLSIMGVQAQEINENLWTTGKIHVVLTVLITIFTGIVIFLLVLEWQVKKLEKKILD